MLGMKQRGEGRNPGQRAASFNRESIPRYASRSLTSVRLRDVLVAFVLAGILTASSTLRVKGKSALAPVLHRTSEAQLAHSSTRYPLVARVSVIHPPTNLQPRGHKYPYGASVTLHWSAARMDSAAGTVSYQVTMDSQVPKYRGKPH